MPKGSHDPSSNLSLTLGREIQLRIHAPHGYDGRKYYDVARGLMINTVEKASFNSIPEYVQRIELTDGTRIKARLSYGIQVVDVWPVVGGSEGTFGALFVFQFHDALSPRIVVIEDEKSPDGVSLEWADNIVGGGFYTQGLTYSKEKIPQTLSVGKEYLNSTYPTLHDAQSNNYSSRQAFVDGFLLVDTAGDYIIGASIVEDKSYCFAVYKIIDNLHYIYFYSHKKIVIDYSIVPGFNSHPPLIDFNDCILDYQFKLNDYDGYQGLYSERTITFCQFNKSGTKASIGMLNGYNINGVNDNLNKQDIYTVTLSANPDFSLNISHSVNVKESYIHEISNTTGAINYIGSTTVDEITGYNQPTCPGYPQEPVYKRTKNLAYVEDDAGFSGNSISVQNNNFILAHSLNNSGIEENVNFTFSHNVDSGGFTNAELRIGDPRLHIFSWTEFMSVDLGLYREEVNAHPQTTKSGFSDFDEETNRTYLFSWDIIGYSFKYNSNINYSDFSLTITTGDPIYNVDPGCSELGARSGYYEDAPATPIIPITYNYSQSSNADSETPIQFSIRDRVSIVLDINLPYNPSILEYSGNTIDRPNFQWAFTEECTQSFLLKLNTTRGSAQIPGLPEFNSSVYVNTSCYVPGKPTEFEPIGTVDRKYYVSADQPKFTAFMITHPKGYTLLAPTDRWIQEQKVSWEEGVTEITGVVLLHVSKTGKFIDLVDKYNELLAKQTNPSHQPISKKWISRSTPLLSLLDVPYCGIVGEKMPKNESRYGYINEVSQ